MTRTRGTSAGACGDGGTPEFGFGARARHGGATVPAHAQTMASLRDVRVVYAEDTDRISPAHGIYALLVVMAERPPGIVCNGVARTAKDLGWVTVRAPAAGDAEAWGLFALRGGIVMPAVVTLDAEVPLVVAVVGELEDPRALRVGLHAEPVGGIATAVTCNPHGPIPPLRRIPAAFTDGIDPMPIGEDTFELRLPEKIYLSIRYWRMH